jgi:transcriptional regulator with XRE-family HTH domain
MPRSRTSPRFEALRDLLVEARRSAGLTQTQVAARLGRYQSYVAAIEAGQRRVDVIEFLDLAEAVGFEPAKMIRALLRTKPRTIALQDRPPSIMSFIDDCTRCNTKTEQPSVSNPLERARKILEASIFVDGKY